MKNGLDRNLDLARFLLWGGIAFYPVLCALPVHAESPENAYLSELLETSRQTHLHEERYWQVLLHRRSSLLGRQQSDVDDPRFFFAPNGRRDAAAELQSTLTAFFRPAIEETDQTQHPQCQFPARYAWLKEKLHFDPARLPEQPCPRFLTWKSRMNPSSISIIFASYYMNNPSSMYGHTFLRLNAAHHSEQQRLLDYAINYGADVRGNNGILFAVYGLTGRYRGNFASLPYYIKVQEYNNLESRDLWEYPLNFNPHQLDRLVAHLWEMGSGTQAYYFLNKNCSYALLPLLEVADPALRLKEKFVFKAIPIDTLRLILAQPGLHEKPIYRPSHISQMFARRDLLSPIEMRLVEKIVRGPVSKVRDDPKVWEQARPVAVVDSAYDLFRYRAGFKKPQPESVMKKEQELLLWRNAIGKQESPSSSISKLSEPVGPESGHLSSRTSVSGGSVRGQGFVEWSIRPSLHDPLDAPQGFLPATQLEMFHVKLRYLPAREKFYIQQFSLIDLVSLSAQDRWIHPMSWRLNAGMRLASDLNKDPDHTQTFGLTLGSGLSAHVPGVSSILVYALGQADAAVGSAFRRTHRLGGGFEAGLVWSQTPRCRLQFKAEQRWYPTGNLSAFSALTIEEAVDITQRIQIRGSASRTHHSKEAKGSLALYF